MRKEDLKCVSVIVEIFFDCRSSFHTSNPSSEATTSGGGGASAAELEEKRRSINKILYRSRQRGLLELDLLIGKWASENVPRMDGQAMEHYTQILDEVSVTTFNRFEARSTVCLF